MDQRVEELLATMTDEEKEVSAVSAVKGTPKATAKGHRMDIC